MPATRKNRKASTRSNKTGKRRVPAKKATTALIKTVLSRQLETKYVAEQLHGSDGGLSIPGNIVPTTNSHSLLPQVVLQGGAAVSNAREGDAIQPIRAHFNLNMWFNNDDANCKIIFVKIFLLHIKSTKYFPLVITDAPDGMFENGTADPVNWVNTSQALQAYYPVCKDNYTVMKTKTFKFMKNYQVPLGGNGAPNLTTLTDRHSFSYSWKPPTLKYAKDLDTYPQNHAPVFYAVAYSPGFNVDGSDALSSAIKMEWQVSMSYKDA